MIKKIAVIFLLFSACIGCAAVKAESYKAELELHDNGYLIINAEAELTDTELIFAVYNEEGELLKLNAGKLTLNKGVNNTALPELNLNGNEYAKVMLWNSMSNGEPYSSVLTLIGDELIPTLTPTPTLTPVPTLMPTQTPMPTPTLTPTPAPTVYVPEGSVVIGDYYMNKVSDFYSGYNRSIRSMDVHDNYAYIGENLYLIKADFSDENKPVYVSKCARPKYGFMASEVVYHDGYLYVSYRGSTGAVWNTRAAEEITFDSGTGNEIISYEIVNADIDYAAEKSDMGGIYG
ncbi:MAG: hypothetical protein ACI4TH_08525, partial [Candidatus Ornithomonoglobus sp.]